MKHTPKQATIRALLHSLFLSILFVTSLPVSAWDRGEAETFALLPHGSGNPEAITADADGDIYVSTLGRGEIHRFEPDGELVCTITLNQGSGLLLDLAFQPDTGDLLVIDFGTREILRVDARSGSTSVFSQIPGDHAIPNMLSFDQAGYVYVSDSAQATIWRIAPTGGTPQVWLSHPLLGTQNYPNFGANGIDFNLDQSILYVANTGDDTIIKIPVMSDGSAGTPSVLANSVNSPDGLIVDTQGNILVASNHGNHILALNPNGTAIAMYGDFDGISGRGIIKGLLSPSDLVKVKDEIFVSNFALDVSTFGRPEHVTSAYTKLVRQFSITRITPERQPRRKDH